MKNLAFLGLLLIIMSSRSMEHDKAECSSPHNMLLNASLSGDVALAQHALKLGASPDGFAYPILKETYLHIAVSLGNLKMVEWLLRHGANANEPDLYGDTPLDKALKSNDEDILSLLLLHGAHLKHEQLYNNPQTWHYSYYFHENLEEMAKSIKKELTVKKGGRTLFDKLKLKMLLPRIVYACHKNLFLWVMRHIKEARLSGHTPFTEPIWYINTSRRDAFFLTQALETAASFNNLAMFTVLYDEIRERRLLGPRAAVEPYTTPAWYINQNIIETDDLFLSILENALFWAAIQGSEDIVTFIIKHAFIEGQATHLSLVSTIDQLDQNLRSSSRLSDSLRDTLVRIRNYLQEAMSIQEEANTNFTQNLPERERRVFEYPRIPFDHFFF